MFLLFSSFFAGILTSLAPCMITLLPVIVGNSVIPGQDNKIDRKKPYIITASLAVSVILFTLLLKASTVLINVDPRVWLYISGGIVILLGVSMLFPNLWVKISSKLGLEHSSNKLLANANKRSGVTGQVLTGAALGPVFASCSPVYALVLATVLPVNLALGMVYIVAFAAGLGLALLAIALGGQKVVSKLGWTANPNGWFRRGLAILLILVGLTIIGGYDKKFQTWAIEKLPFDVTDIEEKLLPSSSSDNNSGGESTLFNVENPYQAAEIQGIQDWINSDPQTIESLKGKVVLLDFWTYSCINCQRTQPYLNDWYDKYNDDGLVILGIHAPEFAFEKVTKNVQRAVVDANIKYAVGLDNNFATWRAYDNQFWPAKYLIDKDGKVRYTHFGEGKYEETEMVIQALLEETGSTVNERITDSSNSSKSRGQTPETYLGYSRGERFVNNPDFVADQPINYSLVSKPGSNEWSLGGTWTIGKESSLSNGETQLAFTFSGKEVYLVMDGPAGALVDVKVDGLSKPGGMDVNANNQVSLDGARLYKLVLLDSFQKDKQLLLTFPKGITINAFTFGS